MIVLFDTSTPLSKIIFIDGQWRKDNEWQSDRNLAKGLLKYLHDEMQKIDKDFSDISGIGAYRGPGSFTGLRIGLTVANTIADSQNIPIVGGLGDDWVNEVLSGINSGHNDKIVLPFYGSEANITIAKK